MSLKIRSQNWPVKIKNTTTTEKKKKKVIGSVSLLAGQLKTLCLKILKSNWLRSDNHLRRTLYHCEIISFCPIVANTITLKPSGTFLRSLTTFSGRCIGFILAGWSCLVLRLNSQIFCWLCKSWCVQFSNSISILTAAGFKFHWWGYLTRTVLINQQEKKDRNVSHYHL